MAQIPGFLTPVIVSQLTTRGTLEEWYVVFTIAGCVFISGKLSLFRVCLHVEFEVLGLRKLISLEIILMYLGKDIKFC